MVMTGKQSQLYTPNNDQQDWGEFLKKIVNDPWVFATKCVFTRDEVDAKNPVKPFPSHFKYLEYFFKVWAKERMVAVPKSRRMFMSWATLTLHVWDAMLHPGRNIAFVSKKEEDADELIKKAVFIIENIPESVWPKELRPVHSYKYCTLEFKETGSIIRGFPQGADQLRMFTFSRIMADEAGFWEHAEAMYSASIPTLEGGGCMTMISSPAPGFFKKLVFDQLDGSDDVSLARRFFPMEGVEVWRNPKNKFVVFQLHYSANPAKKGALYRSNIKDSMPYNRYMQEYELSWETYEGKPVYPDWNKNLHGSKETLYPEFGLPLLLGIDQGLYGACLVCQMQGDTLIVLREYLAENKGAERFKEIVKNKLALEFPEWPDLEEDFLVGMDPTGFNRRDTDERTYAMVWADKKTGKFRPMPGDNGWEKRRSSVERRLTRIYNGKPTLLVDLTSCPLLVRGFDGGYRYPERSFEEEPLKIKPVKDEHSDPQDALQYISTLMDHKSRERKYKSPALNYGPAIGGKNG